MHTHLQYCRGWEADFDFLILANQYGGNDLASLGPIKERVFESEEIGTCKR